MGLDSSFANDSRGACGAESAPRVTGDLRAPPFIPNRRPLTRATMSRFARRARAIRQISFAVQTVGEFLTEWLAPRAKRRCELCKHGANYGDASTLSPPAVEMVDDFAPCG